MQNPIEVLLSTSMRFQASVPTQLTLNSYRTDYDSRYYKTSITYLALLLPFYSKNYCRVAKSCYANTY